MSGFDAEAVTNLVQSLNSHVGEGLSTSGGSLHVDALALESDGTVRGGIAELTAKGHAEQVSTTGKNLLPNNATLQTANGVTFIVNADGSVTCNGTATSDVALYLVRGTNYPAEIFPIDDATYTVSIGVESRYLSGISWAIKTSDQGWIDQPKTRNLSGNVESFWIMVRSGNTVSNLTFYPMLRLASITDDTYEPYTGGAPSPSPDYPQEIQVVRGRNLIFKTIQNANIASNGTITSSSNFMMHVAIIAQGMTYTMTTSDISGAVYGFFASEPALGSTTYDGTRIISGTSKTFVAPIDGYVAFRSGSDYTTPQLELGSTPTPYVPYGHVGMEAQGKNLLSNTNTSRTENGVTFTVNANGTISLSGTATQDTTYVLSSGIKDWPNGTFTLSGCPVGGGLSTYRLRIDDKNGNALAQDWGGGTGTLQFTITDGTVSTIFINVKAGVNTNGLVFRPMIEIGSTATPYEPYFHTTTPIPLPQRGWVAGLPDGTADALRLDGAGHVEWTLPTSEVVLDGSVTLTDRAEYGDNLRIGISIPNKATVGSSEDARKNVIFDKFIADIIPVKHPNYSEAVGKGMMLDSYGVLIVMLKSVFESTSSTDILNYFSTHPITVLYPIATPVTEDCGYVEDWPTDIPEGAVITIPELDALNIKYFIGSDVTELAKQWYERTNDTDIAQVEDAVADLTSVAANLVTHDLFYFGYDEVNGKKMISIFKRGDI